jgi:hypothetical protein
MGRHSRSLGPASAYGSRFERMPLFKAANRMNAYNTDLSMEQQGGR